MATRKKARKNPPAKTKIKSVAKEKEVLDRLITSGIKSRRKKAGEKSGTFQTTPLDSKGMRKLDREKIIGTAVKKAFPGLSLTERNRKLSKLIGPSKGKGAKKDVRLLNPRMDKKKKR